MSTEYGPEPHRSAPGSGNPPPYWATPAENQPGTARPPDQPSPWNTPGRPSPAGNQLGAPQPPDQPGAWNTPGTSPHAGNQHGAPQPLGEPGAWNTPGSPSPAGNQPGQPGVWNTPGTPPPAGNQPPNFWQTPDQPGGWFPPGAPPPSPARRGSPTGLLVGLALLAVVILVGGAVFVAVNSSGGKQQAAGTSTSPPPTSSKPTPPPPPVTRTFRLPLSFDRYQRETGSQARQVTNGLRQVLRKGGAPKARAAIYTASPDDGLIFVGFTAAENPALRRRMSSNPPSRIIESMDVQTSNTRSFPPGRFGGAMRCGRQRERNLVVCLWATQRLLGMLLSPEQPLHRLADVTVRFRNAAER
jgi:hypothetical protein